MAHMKRHMAPKRWPIHRKGTTFVVKPNFNPRRGIPVLIILRDILKVCQNRKEAKKAINAKHILDAIPKHKKILGFCSTIQQAEELYKHTLHSKTSRDDFDEFAESTGMVKRLGTVFKANMSINIPDLDIAFIAQVQSKSVHMLQRTGRMVRKSKDPNKVGRVIVLVVKGTQDEVWLKQALREFDESNITYVTINSVIQRGFSNIIKVA